MRAEAPGSGRVLVVDDDRDFCETLTSLLVRRGHHARWEATGARAMAALEEQEFDAVVVDINLSDTNGLQLCTRLASDRPNLPVVVMTAFGNVETAVAALRAGAADYLMKPFEFEALAIALRRALTHRELREAVGRLHQSATESRGFDEVLGASAAMKKVSDLLDRVVDSEASVLITGESGTGKE